MVFNEHFCQPQLLQPTDWVSLEEILLYHNNLLPATKIVFVYSEQSVERCILQPPPQVKLAGNQPLNSILYIRHLK